MNLTVDIQIASSSKQLPSKAQLKLWVAHALSPFESKDYEVSLRLVDSAEITALNLQYRGKDKATNVLSFPTDFPEELELPLLGDIVICAQVVEEEALAQEKNLTAHWAHMVIHGMLHLLGFDHIDDADADEMEGLEIELLEALHYPSPYENDSGDSYNEDRNKP